jgi:GGDEF domain-containing protein
MPGIDGTELTRRIRRLHRDARQDALTGLGNRYRLAEDLEAMRARAERYGHRCCVALVDVDRFKGYNDGFVHLRGDELLRRPTAAILRPCSPAPTPPCTPRRPAGATASRSRAGVTRRSA